MRLTPSRRARTGIFLRLSIVIAALRLDAETVGFGLIDVHFGAR
jgi:hypothetical protein